MSKNCQQACAVPYRKEHNIVTFCLITSRSHNDWIFPKGNIDGAETPQETALKEAEEEAGLEGTIVTSLGTFSYEKRGLSLLVAAELMEVTVCKDRWLEKKYRKRCWVSFSEAENLIQRAEMKSILKKAIEHVNAINR
ncbi:NUDIX hydrolase [Candidatus Uabimicrobium sp. HlEnr_7]|uniref:NUDIX hydrolase n=1 Tax=Candidatus Uabimicrobium helgolandensis TaxID=3095367 RepID=UPI003555CEBD